MKLQCGAVITRIPHLVLTLEQRGYWEKWLHALESGKYSQIKSALRTTEGFCCLGVACDVVDPKGWKMGNGAHAYSFRCANALPTEQATKDCIPPSLRNLYGMQMGPLGFHVGGKFPVEVGSDALELKALALASLNDDMGVTFPEIAKIIRLAITTGYIFHQKVAVTH